MAKKQPTPEPAAEAEPARGPDNTPIPGGGSWIWDRDALDWAPHPLPEPQPAPSSPPAAKE